MRLSLLSPSTSSVRGSSSTIRHLPQTLQPISSTLRESPDSGVATTTTFPHSTSQSPTLDMLPTELSPSPLRTQVRHVFRASVFSVFVHLKTTPSPPATDPSARFFVLANGVAENPTLTRVIQGDQLQLYNITWPAKTLTYLYYYGGTPVIPLASGPDLFARWDPVPSYEYQRPRPLMPTFINSFSVNVDVHVDREISTGSTNPVDWVVYANGTPYQPFTVTIFPTYIRLSHIQYSLKDVTRVVYLKGAIPYVADDSGELQSLDLNYPYPP